MMGFMESFLSRRSSFRHLVSLLGRVLRLGGGRGRWLGLHLLDDGGRIDGDLLLLAAALDGQSDCASLPDAAQDLESTIRVIEGRCRSRP
jgi:hypothetical protein